MKRLIGLLGALALTGCSATMVKYTTAPDGGVIEAVSMRDGFTNANALLVYDKNGKLQAAVPGSATTAAGAWSSISNASAIEGITTIGTGILTGAIK